MSRNTPPGTVSNRQLIIILIIYGILFALNFLLIYLWLVLVMRTSLCGGS